MKNLKSIIAAMAIAIITGGVFTACNKHDDIISNDATINAAATIDVGPTTATQGQITNITTNTTWSSANVYRLNGYIRVLTGATLTIQAGTTVIGKSISRGALIIEKGGKLTAIGTSCSPIVFTSAEATKAPGDWSGVILCGNATVNTGTSTNQIEGLFGSPSNPSLGQYGGSTDTDNSGTLQYVRIEYAGIIQDASVSGNETNGLTFGGVGSGTTIDHIEVAFSNDDAFEWFGGTVNCKYLFSYRNRDDDFDTDNGFSGKLQFLWALRDPAFADGNKTAFGGAAVAGSGSNGFESDNNATSTTSTPRTAASFSNATIYGPRASNPASLDSGYYAFSGGGYGAFTRRRSLERIHNSVIFGWTKSQYNITTSGDWSNTCSATTTTATNNTVAFNNSASNGLTPSGFEVIGISFLSDTSLRNRSVTSANLLTTLGLPSFNILNPNPVPNAGSILLNTVSASGSTPASAFTACSLTDAFFNKPLTAAVSFRGAFAPASAGDVAGSFSGSNGWNIPSSCASGQKWVRYFNKGL